MADSDPDLDEIARDLYARDAADFTKARNERAADLRRNGDRALAGRIAKLPRPAAAAAAINALVRRDPDALRPLDEVRDRLQEAQDDGDRHALIQLSTERRRTVGDLVDAVRQAAELSASTADALERTLLAAVASERAADAVGSGMLVSPLTPGEVGDDVVAAAVATGSLGLPRERSSGRGAARSTAPAPERGDREAERARRDAERAAEQAEKAAGAARTEEDDARHAEADAAARRDRLEAERDRLRDRLSAAQRDLDRAEGSVDRAGEAVHDALRARREAERRARRLRDQVDADDGG